MMLKQGFSLSILTVLFVALFTGVSAYSAAPEEVLKSYAKQEIEQPIKFSHKTHAGTNKIACEYCHFNAKRSQKAGVPPLKTCHGCHSMVKGTTEAQQKEIQKVIDHWDKKQPIAWKQTHDIPDFVYFSHKRHIKAGLDCSSCHGDVSKIDGVPNPYIRDAKNQVTQTKDIPLSMGWCMTCHKTDHPTVDGKILSPERLTRGASESKPASLKADGTKQGPKDCLICHK